MTKDTKVLKANIRMAVVVFYNEKNRYDDLDVLDRILREIGITSGIRYEEDGQTMIASKRGFSSFEKTSDLYQAIHRTLTENGYVHYYVSRVVYLDKEGVRYRGFITDNGVFVDGFDNLYMPDDEHFTVPFDEIQLI